MSESNFTSNMELEFSFRNTEVDSDIREDFGKVIKEANEQQRQNTTDEYVIVDSRYINDQSSNINSAAINSSADGSKQHCGSITTRFQGRKRKRKPYQKVIDKRKRLDDKNTKKEAQRQHRIEDATGDSNQNESQASCMFPPDTPLDAVKGWSCKKPVDFVKTVCLKGGKPSSTVTPFQSQLMTSKSESQSSFQASNCPKKEVSIEMPDPVEKGKYVKVKGEAKRIKLLNDCDLNPFVNRSEKVLNAKEEIQVFLYEDMFVKKFDKIKDKKTVKVGKGKYKKFMGKARKIKFLKYCDLNPYVNLGKRVPHTKEEIQVFLYKDMFTKKLDKVKGKKTVKMEKGKYITVTGEARKIKFLKSCDLNPYVNLGKRVPHTKEEIRVFLYKDMLTKKCNKVKDKKTVKNIEMKPKLSPLQKTSKTVDLEKFSSQTLFSKNTSNKAMLPEVLEGTEKKERITCQEKMENVNCSERNFDVKLSPDDACSENDSKMLIESRASASQNMEKNESEKSLKSELHDILPKVGARKNSNQPLIPEMPVSPANKASASSKPDQNVTNKSAKANYDKYRKERRLFDASNVGDYNQIIELLSLGVSIETENLKELANFECITPLQIAVRNGHVKCVEVLIHHGANVSARNKYGCTALHLAVKNNRYMCLKMLLEARAAGRAFISSYNILNFSDDSGTTALHLAFHYCNEECAKILLRFGANCNVVNMMGYTPLHFAVKHQMLSCIRELIRQGANCNAVDMLGDTLLHFAVKKRKLSSVKELIKLGANCNAVDMMGDTPLYYAVRCRMLPFVKELIRLGANCNAVDMMGNTPLHFAVKYTMLSYVKELVHGGSDINFLNRDGFSPLHLVCRYSIYLDSWEDEEEKNDRKMEILKLLVLEGYNTDINKTASGGSTALSLAFKSFNFPMIKFLISHGAHVNAEKSDVLKCLDYELTAPGDDLDNMKCIVKCMLQLPQLKSHNLLKRIRNKNSVVENAVCHDLVLPDNLKFQFVQTETQIYVEMYNYELMTEPGDVRYPLQEPLLSLLYERAIDELKYRDKNSGNGIWYCFSHFCTEQLLLLKKILWYEQIASTPRTLQHYSRYCIRKCMGPTNLKHIRQLPLPETLLTYLLFKSDE